MHSTFCPQSCNNQFRSKLNFLWYMKYNRQRTKSNCFTISGIFL